MTITQRNRERKKWSFTSILYFTEIKSVLTLSELWKMNIGIPRASKLTKKKQRIQLKYNGIKMVSKRFCLTQKTVEG